MNNLTRRNRFLSVAMMALLLALIIPATALGQGRRYRRGGVLGNRCGVFVNCHDARDGRWDGRGPRGDRVGNVILLRNRRHRNFDRRIWWQRRALRRNR